AIDVDGYKVLKEAWLKQVEEHPDNQKILANAARFVQMDDRELAEKFFLKAKELKPNDSQLIQELANFYKLGAGIEAQKGQRGESSDKGLQQFEEGVECAADDLHRF